MYAASQLLCFTYIISKYFATEAQKRLRNISSNSFFSVLSVPTWQKRFTPKGDLTTAYISDQYQCLNVTINLIFEVNSNVVPFFSGAPDGITEKRKGPAYLKVR